MALHLVLIGTVSAYVFAFAQGQCEAKYCPVTSSNTLLQVNKQISKRDDVTDGINKDVRVGIVTMSYGAIERSIWLEYHLVYAGVDHIFLQIEDEHGVSKMLDKLDAQLKKRVTIFRTDADILVDKHNEQNVMYRQEAAATNAMRIAPKLGLDWLFHIDDDELLYSPNGFSIGEAIKKAQITSDIDQLVIKNAEAIFEPNDTTRCFSSAKWMNTDYNTFISYGNGKAGARVSTGSRAMEAWGVHRWHYSDSSRTCNSTKLSAQGTRCVGPVPSKIFAFGSAKSEADLPMLMLMHYDSCTVECWIAKMWRERNYDSDHKGKTLHDYRKDSFNQIKLCDGRYDAQTASAKVAPGCNRTEMAQVWMKWKTTSNPNLKTGRLFPISIPWDQIYQAV